MSFIFSVIIPAFNAEKYIGETIESALDQRDVSCEIIVVDDGSEDNTVKIVNSFQPHINLIQQKNSGASAARNNGAKSSKGEILAFLDSDDLWLPDKLISQKIKFDKGFNVVYTNRYNIGDLGDLPEIQSEIEAMHEGDIFEYLLMNNFITNSSVAIRKSLFFDMNGFNTKLLTCEDWDLWLRCAEVNIFGFCSEPLVKYRFHSSGKSRNYKRQATTREVIITSILNSERGKQLSEDMKKKVWAHSFSTSAWASARSKDISFALKMYLNALKSSPFDTGIWYDIARTIAGRI